jgi:cob(I)alamin adenosyltransferase
MPRLTKIYTRKGDDGTTALGSRMRVKKNSLRVCSYGEVDELNSIIGLALSFGMASPHSETLIRIQNELLVLGSELAFPAGEKEFEIPIIEKRHIELLEITIDAMNSELGPLENFILPGGSPTGASLQLARTVCRRAERSMVALAEKEELSSESLAYINRLSDFLFVLARYENEKSDVQENIWNSRI